MSTTVNINIKDSGSESGSLSDYNELKKGYDELSDKYNELIRFMGHEYSPFPSEGIDGFLSHFIITMELMIGDNKGEVVSITMPVATQTVTRSNPFIYKGKDKHVIKFKMPEGCSLPDTIKESDFLHSPEEYFEEGKETVWMQIINLDARMEETPIGPVRIILGQTLLNEYPDIFQPSLGVAQALGKKGGFPSRLFFNPYAIIETEFGSMRAIHGTLSYGRVTSFPPVGTAISICEMIPLEPVEKVREVRALRGINPEQIEPFARIIALAHPIDTPMQISGDEAFRLIEGSIKRKKKDS